MGFDTIEINLVLWSIHDTWPMTLNTWHFTHDTEYMTLYTWHMTLNEWHFTHDTRYMNLTHNTWHMTLDTAGFEEFSNIRMGAIAQTKFLSNGNQMHQLQQKITSRQQFVDWTTWPCLKKGFFTLCLAQKHTFIFQFPLGIKLFWAQKHTFIFCFAWEWTLAEQHDLRNCAVSKWGLLHKKVDSISQQWQQLQTRLESKP